MEMTDVLQSLMTYYSVSYLQSISQYDKDVSEALSDANIQIYNTNFTHGTFKNNQVRNSKDRKAASCFYGTVAILHRAYERKIPIVLRFPGNVDVIYDDYSDSECFIVFDCLPGSQYSEGWLRNQTIETINLTSLTVAKNIYH